MLTKCTLVRVGRVPQAFARSFPPFHRRVSSPKYPAPRYYSSSTCGPATSQGATSNALSPLAGLTDELNRIAPRFDVDPDAIEVIKGPARFYEVLKAKILKAKSRIYLSTLYIGKTEHELISTIRTALLQNESLKVSFLSDALRGTRETPNPTTASLLAPLISEFGSDRVQIRMYHTPNLTGLRKRFIPKRINEGWGLQHMKLYGIDDEIILSGANLSNDYFTNRLDRYHLFRSKPLTDYYHRIHSSVCDVSFDIQPSDARDAAGYTMSWPTSNLVKSPLDDPKAYIAHVASTLTPLIASRSSAPLTPSTSSSSSSTGTTVYPLFQFTPFFSKSESTTDSSTELPAMTALLTCLSRIPTKTTFTAGYFNPTSSFVSHLLSAHPSSQTTVIAASPYANGFYGSKGISGLLPPAYTLLSKRFLEEAKRRGVYKDTGDDGERVKLLEWRRGTVGEGDGWTYHAKGIWITLLRQQQAQGNADAIGTGELDVGPCVTIIGSSNYTKRSYTLDLEANAMIVTGDEGLKKRLREEEEWLREDAKWVGLDEFRRTERRVGVHVRLAMWITSLVGGAL